MFSIIRNKLKLTSSEQLKYQFDYQLSDQLIRLFTVLWVIYRVYLFQPLKDRPKELYEPSSWFHSIFSPIFPNESIFYGVAFIAILLAIRTIINKSILERFILFFLILWLHSIFSSYHKITHVSHLFLYAHLFFAINPSSIKIKTKKESTTYTNIIQSSIIGILLCYSLAGAWKFLSLAHATLLSSSSITWLNPLAAETNAFSNFYLIDKVVPDFMLKMYEIPYLWEICTILIFLIQLISISAAFNKKLANLILVGLVSFHLYNILFVKVFFYDAIYTLIIVLFPYHFFLKKRFEAFKKNTPYKKIVERN